MKDNVDAECFELHSLNKLIEDKINWGPVLDWSHYQFEELSHQIEKETGILLSTNTLKRALGKIDCKSSPSKTTKNTLARFCGFENYYAFVKSLAYQSGQKNVSGRALKFIMIVAGAFALVFLSLHFLPRTKHQEFYFHQVYDEGLVPFTQIYKYHVNPNLTDSVYFKEGSKGQISLSTSDSVFSWMHFVPGYRDIKFIARGKTLWESSYRVNTDGWLFIFPHGGLSPRKYISLNNSEGLLSVDEELLDENKIDLSEDGGWVNYFNMQDYQVDGKDFTFEALIKNELRRGYQQCQDAIISIECQGFIFSIHFTQTGCQKYAELSMGKDYYGGIQNDLTSLTFDLNQWQKISIISNQGNLSVYNEDRLLLEKPYSGHPGTISGLHFSFRGIGSVDDISIYDGDGAMAFREEF